jgi:hypothetical protein
MKLPFTSWRISSQTSEHCKSGKMRVGVMDLIVELLSR